MRQFLKFTFASAIGFFISMALVVTIGAIFIFTTLSTLKKEFKEGFSSKEKTKIQDKSVLRLEFDYPIRERSRYNFQYGDYEVKRKLGLQDILDAIKRAKTDAKIKGVYLNLDGFQGSLTKSEEIRKQLVNFKENTDKFVYAYGSSIGQSAYHFGSIADKFFLNPTGRLFFNGLSAEVMFFKNTLEKLKIEPQIFKSGKYKSAIEPFYRDEMSEPSREQTRVMLNTIFDNMINNIAAYRPLSSAELDKIADSLLVRNAEDALEHQLVDDLFHKDEFLAKVRSQLEIEEGDDINFVEISDYVKKKKDKNRAGKKIAIVYGQGAIEQGDSKDEAVISSVRLSNAIKEARKDTSVKAIVLRVNSPGGSALASDIIWRQVKLARQQKPLIVSMSDVAASGGYYISCAADTIVAHPNTLTGSIGVFGFLPNMQNFFKEKLGITFDRVTTRPFSDFITTNRSLTKKEEQIFQQEIDRIYTKFLNRVSAGRGLSKDSIHAIAQGRVWTGEDAQQVGLVDVLGGSQKAIEIAAQKANLEDYALKAYPKKQDPFERLMERFTGDMQSLVMDWKFGDQHPRLEKAKQYIKMDGIQARMPYEFIIE